MPRENTENFTMSIVYPAFVGNAITLHCQLLPIVYGSTIHLYSIISIYISVRLVQQLGLPLLLLLHKNIEKLSKHLPIFGGRLQTIFVICKSHINLKII